MSPDQGQADHTRVTRQQRWWRQVEDSTGNAPAVHGVRKKKLIKKKFRIKYGKHRPSLQVQADVAKALKQNTVKQKEMKPQNSKLVKQLTDNKLQVTEFISVSEFANLMDVSFADVISKCMSLGIMVSINQRLRQM